MIRGAVERPSKARCQSGERIAIMNRFMMIWRKDIRRAM
jgi:hypothetical protein